jgi:predicted GNAT family acetyltransferase
MDIIRFSSASAFRERAEPWLLGAEAARARIGYVYSPPEWRGRGYATACVARVSQRVLDSGLQFCFLYTDLSNPTSNSIYRRLGYRPVYDVVAIGFLAGGA